MAQTDRGDGLVGTLGVKAPCRVVTTAPITLYGLQTIDSIVVVAGDRVLVKDQVDTIENGIWVAQATDWYRSADYDGLKDVAPGTLVTGYEGTANNGSIWQTIGTAPIIPSESQITFTRKLLSAAEAQAYLDAANAAATNAAASAAAAQAAQAAAEAVASTASGAVGGGTDAVFYENDKTVSFDYTISSGRNAVSAGPITINTGVTVGIPDGSTWTIVGS